MGNELSKGRRALRPGFVHEMCGVRRISGSKEWQLVVDGEVVATVLSTMKPDRRFRDVDRVRRTEVQFHDGFWLIRTRTPGQYPTQPTVFGPRAAKKYRIEDRTVEVHARLYRASGDSGQDTDRVLARVEQIGRRRATCVTDSNGRYTLSGDSIEGIGRWRSGSLALRWLKRRSPRSSALSVSRSIPLTVALCHWHLMNGDYRKEFSGGVA